MFLLLKFFCFVFLYFHGTSLFSACTKRVVQFKQNLMEILEWGKDAAVQIRPFCFCGDVASSWLEFVVSFSGWCAASQRFWPKSLGFRLPAQAFFENHYHCNWARRRFMKQINQTKINRELTVFFHIFNPRHFVFPIYIKHMEMKVTIGHRLVLISWRTLILYFLFFS